MIYKNNYIGATLIVPQLVQNPVDVKSLLSSTMAKCCPPCAGFLLEK